MEIDVWSRPEACAAAMSVFQLAVELPVLRPASSEAARRAASGLPERAETVPKAVVEEVIATLPAEDVTRLVELAGELAPERWRTLVAEVGPEAALEPLLVGVATCAVSELRPPPRWLAEMREATSDAAPGPLNVLASLLRWEAVWSAEEIRAAHDRADRALPIPQRYRAALSYADTELTPQRLERARYVAEPVRRILPLERAPRTTRQLSEALALLDRAGGAEELCRALLLMAVMDVDGLVPVAPSRN